MAISEFDQGFYDGYDGREPLATTGAYDAGYGAGHSTKPAEQYTNSPLRAEATGAWHAARAAAQQAAQPPAPAPAPAPAPVHEHAHAGHHPRSILEKETDVRFWLQQHFRPGQKLDPSNPTDAAMVPVWKDMFAKVKAEDDAGSLVITYNNPVVAQKLADAIVADKATAMHADAAAASPDPAEQQHNIAAASTGSQISAQRAHEGAQLQPPTVSPPLAHEAAEAVKQMPPPPHAPAGEHIAHMQARSAGQRAVRVHDHHARHRPRRPVKSTVPPGSIQNYRVLATQIAHGAGAPFVLVIQHPDGTPDQQAFGSRAELDAAYAQISEQHDQYKYVAAFDLAANPSTPVHDSVGIPAAEHIETPAPEGAPSPEEHQHHREQTQPAPMGAAPTEEGWSIGKKIAVAVAVIAGVGGLVYLAGRKPSRAPSRARAPAIVSIPGIPRSRALRGP